MEKYRQKLEKKKDQRGIIGNWRDSLPFVNNSNAVLIHRPRRVSVHRVLGKMHIAIEFSCGQMSCGTKKFTFLQAPELNDVVCAR